MVTTQHTTGSDQRRGQTLPFFIMALLIMAVIVIWNFDLHKIYSVKYKAQNAGDAAALAAARYQGITLNLVGDLNIMQAVALSTGNTNAASAIALLQAKVAYVGPMVALLASQQAAKNNGMHNNDQFTDYMLEHAEEVATAYPAEVNAAGDILFPEPYPNAWADYSSMLGYIANEGIAAGPDNMSLYSDGDGGHWLLNVGFYDAVAGDSWCWFHHNATELLTNYTGWTWWAPLPPPTPTRPINSEIYGLGLSKRFINDDLTEVVSDLRDDRQLSDITISNVFNLSANWYCYGGGWQEWTIMTGSDGFPIMGPVKDKYNYAGADAAVRVEAVADRVSPDTPSSPITWTAAAKPFGTLEGDVRPNAYTLVLPAFHDVRLIPIDASSAPAGGGYNLYWREHVEVHLPEYINTGQGQPGCYYCNQLRKWEPANYRNYGIAWLRTNSQFCVTTSGSGGGGSGGTRRGH